MPKKILILSFSGIGNSLMAVPFINCLKERVNHEQIDILCLNKAIAEAFVLTLGPVRTIILPRGIFHGLATLLELRREKYDVCITLFPSNRWQFDLIAFLSGAKKRVTHTYQADRFSAFLQNVKIPAESDLHDVDQNLRLLSAFDINYGGCYCDFTYHLREADQKFSQDFIAANKIDKSFIVGIHPGAGSDYGNQGWQGKGKRWSEENFAALCNRLIQEKDAAIILFGGKNELELKNKIKSQVVRTEKVFLAHTLSLAHAAALMAKCNLFISNDSGLMHLAAFMDLPVVGIFGPTNHSRTAPAGKRSFYIRAKADCSPCLRYPFHSTRSKLDCKEGLKCFSWVTVDDVMQFLKQKELV